MESPEVFFDIYCDEAIVLAKIRESHPEVDIEFSSGLGGLDIVGTLVIPGAALALQIFSLIKDLRQSSYPSLTIKKLHLQIGKDHKVFTHHDDASIEEILRKLQ